MRWRFYLSMTALIGFSTMLLGTAGALGMLGGVGPEGGERGPGGEGVPPGGCGSPPPQPVVTSISPTSGAVGSSVVISGQHLDAPLIRVFLNGVNAQTTAVSDTAVTAIIPTGASTGHITVTVYGPQPACISPSIPTDADIFTVTTSRKHLLVPELCCNVVANSALKGRFGRLLVTFPAAAVPTATRIAVLKDGKEVQADYGSHSWELLSGTYDVTISGKRIPNVTVKAGHDTNVKVGVLRITAAKNMRAAVLEGGQEIAGGYGGELIGLPAGSFDVQMAGQTEKVTISEGKITDF